MATSYEIHPAIGIARVGDGDDFFLGPEPGQPAPTTWRDATRRLKRQAARFRVFACERDADGKLTSAREVTPAEARVEWTVHVANRKAAGHRFLGDGLRNPREEDRAALAIDPGPRTLAGPHQTARLDGGRFLGIAVDLGDLRTDEDGRLLVLGGRGHSGYVEGDDGPPPLKTFSDNDGWYDDTSDGSVRAKLTFSDGASATAAPAWVLIAPPDFAPAVENLVTLHDAILHAAVERGWIAPPARPSFSRHIQPFLRRALGYRWVSKQGRSGHGPDGAGDFILRWDFLSDPRLGQDERRAIFATLRVPGSDARPSGPAMPMLHDSQYSKNVLPLTPTQYQMMKQWAAGDFVAGDPAPPAELLPDALTRVALEACAGGPFYPGIEVGRLIADPSRYAAPFRLDAGALEPGQMTEGNALPWQADFYDCAWDEGLGWWPAQRPDAVHADVGTSEMVDWARGIDTKREMVERWSRLGVVVKKLGGAGEAVFVETEREL